MECVSTVPSFVDITQNKYQYIYIMCYITHNKYKYIYIMCYITHNKYKYI